MVNYKNSQGRTQINTDDFRVLSFVPFGSFVVPSSLNRSLPFHFCWRIQRQSFASLPDLSARRLAPSINTSLPLSPLRSAAD